MQNGCHGWMNAFLSRDPCRRAQRNSGEAWHVWSPCREPIVTLRFALTRWTGDNALRMPV